MTPAYVNQSPIWTQSYAPISGRPPPRSSETKIPCSRITFVSCVAELWLRKTLIVSEDSWVQADQRLAPEAAAATRPVGDPSGLEKRNWPTHEPFRCGCQSIAPEVKVSTTWRRPRTSTGAAPGASELDGKPAFVMPIVRKRPRLSDVTSRRNDFPELNRSAYANAGRPAESSVSPAGPKEAPFRGLATTRTGPPERPRASQEPPSAWTRTLVRPCRSITSPDTKARPVGTRPARREDQRPPAVRRATVTSLPTM
jgi:hypothetical protein